MTPAETAFRTAYMLAGGPPFLPPIDVEHAVSLGWPRCLLTETGFAVWTVVHDPDLTELLSDALDALLIERPDIAASIQEARS